MPVLSQIKLILTAVFVGFAVCYSLAESDQDANFWRKVLTSVARTIPEKAAQDRAAIALIDWGMRLENAEQKKLILIKLKNHRSEFSLRTQYILSALEIKYQVADQNTLQVARRAIEEIRINDQGLLTSDIRPRLLFVGDGSLTVLELENFERISFLYLNWLGLIRDQEITPRLANGIVKWVRNVKYMRKHLKLTTLHALLNVLGDDFPLKLRDPRLRKEFLDESVRVIVELREKYGTWEWTGRETIYEIDKRYQESYDIVKKQILNWIDFDPEYLLENFTRLQGLNILSLNEVADQRTFRRSVLSHILSSKMVGGEAIWLASLLWLKSPAEKYSRMDVDQGLAIKYCLDVLSSAGFYFNKVAYKVADHETKPMSETEFYRWVDATFEALRSFGRLSPYEAETLLATKLIKAKEIGEKTWFELEWKRLAVVEQNMTPEKFKQKLTENILGKGTNDLHQRVLSSLYLRIKLQSRELEVLAAKIKGAKTTDEAWEKNKGEMVSLLTALNPDDRDLRDYLTRVFDYNLPMGVINGTTSLNWLENIKASHEGMRESLKTRLLTPSAANTGAMFQTFVRLYPDEGKAINEIIYNHFSYPEKLKAILTIALRESLENENLYISIIDGYRQMRNLGRIQHFQGKTFDHWISEKLGKNLPRENKCGGLF